MNLYGNLLQAQLRVQDDGYAATPVQIQVEQMAIVFGAQAFYLPTVVPDTVIPGLSVEAILGDGQGANIPMLWTPKSHAGMLRALKGMEVDLARRKLVWANAEQVLGHLAS